MPYWDLIQLRETAYRPIVLEVDGANRSLSLADAWRIKTKTKIGFGNKNCRARPRTAIVRDLLRVDKTLVEAYGACLNN